MLLLLTLFLHTAHAFSDDYSTLLQRYVNADGSVDYAKLKDDPLLKNLPSALEQAPLPTERNTQLAFWINAYNALTLLLIAHEYPLRSIQDLDDGKVWSTRTFDVSGQLRTLDEIEHQILRPLKEPRIHAAINCGSKGCPPLWNQPFTAPNIQSELDSAMRRWFQANAYQVSETQLAVSNIFIWFKDDFTPAKDRHYPAYPTDQWGILYTLEHYSQQDEIKAAIQKGYPLQTLPYDWSLNTL